MINALTVQVNQLKDLKWQSFNLHSNYHTYDLQHQQIKFTNGLVFNVPRILINAKNVAINNDSILILSDTHKISNIFTEITKAPAIKNIINNTALLIYKYIPEYSTNSFVNKQGVQTIIKNIVTPEQNIYYYLSTKNNNFSLTNQESVVSSKEIYNLEFTEDAVSIYNIDNQYLTDRGIFVQLLNKQENFIQKFNYILNEDNIILFKFNSNYTVVVDFSFNTGSVSFVNIAKLQDIPSTSLLHIRQLKNFNTNFSSIKESFLAKYTTSPLSASNTLELNSDIKEKQYLQNYLINIPIKTYSSNDSSRVAYINSLKNYQTTNYNYLIQDTSLSNREYTNIFTGTNQHLGYNNIFLNFTSNTLEKTFATDTETVFHYPSTCPTSGIPISASNLIEEGAISGKNPYTSDRVLMSRKDYRELNIPLLSAIIADNTWLYAWLSAGDDGDSIWVDRFYTGAKYDITDFEYLSYQINDPLFVDVPSTLTFLPNRVYKYFHQGPKTIKKYVDQLPLIDRQESSKILEINDWSNNILVDQSSYNNNGVIASNKTNLSKDYFYLDGTSYALFPATSSLDENRQLYAGFWLKVDNWNEIEGSQIFGNYADGGYGLFNKQNIPTSFITMVDNNNNYLYNFNSNFKPINEQKLITSTNVTNNKPIFIIRTADQNYWLINANTLTAGKYDLNNNLLLEITDLSPIKNITQVEIDDIDRIYILDNVKKKLIIFNSNTGVIISELYGKDFNYKRLELTTSPHSSYYSNIVSIEAPIERTNAKLSRVSVIGVNSDFSVIDNNNNLWHSVGVNLYKNNSLYANIGEINYITCDNKNNIWILHDRYKVTKIDSITNLISFTKVYTSVQFDVIEKTEQKRFINFISIKENNKETDYTIIVDNEEKTCYLLNLNGTLYNKINLLIIPTIFLSKRNFNRDNIFFTCYGDFTGYQFQRKFNNNKELTWKVKITKSSGYTDISNNTSDKIIYLPFSTSNIDQGWHYFSFLFDHQKGNISVYVDGIKMNEYKFNPFEYIIKQSLKPLTLGAITTDQGLLNDTIGMNDKHKTIAYVTGLHMYKYSFNINEIKLLHKSTFINLYKDLTWNINIGSRNYIEQIDKFFMQKLPGNKSKFFNLKIKNFKATKEQKKLIDEAIRQTINKIIPADTVLHNIKWES